MAVLISGHFVYAGRVGGAEHMAYNIVRGMEKAGAKTIFLCHRRSNLSVDFVRESDSENREILECGGSGSRFIAEQRACIGSQLRGDAILFPNYALPLVVPRQLGRRSVVIHDFQYCHFPEFFSAKKRAWLRFSHRHALSRAEQIIFISNFVKQDAVRLFGASAERGIVIPNPISWDRFGPERGPHPLDGRPYILSVAAQYPHKRLDVLIRAFALLARRRDDVMLVLTGQLADRLVAVGGDRIGLSQLIVELGISHRVRVTGYVDDRELGDLYHHAAVFAFPSIFEGFGMPATEALGFGVPTVTTSLTAMPETTLGLAEYIKQAEDPQAWAERLEGLVDAPRLCARTVGRIRDRYSPDTIGKLYKNALGGGVTA